MTGNPASCPIVIRRDRLSPDELAPNALIRRELSYLRAANCRNQASMVAGFTSWQHCRRFFGVNSLPASARRRRWSGVK